MNKKTHKILAAVHNASKVQAKEPSAHWNGGSPSEFLVAHAELVRSLGPKGKLFVDLGNVNIRTVVLDTVVELTFTTPEPTFLEMVTNREASELTEIETHSANLVNAINEDLQAGNISAGKANSLKATAKLDIIKMRREVSTKKDGFIRMFNDSHKTWKNDRDDFEKQRASVSTKMNQFYGPNVKAIIATALDSFLFKRAKVKVMKHYCKSVGVTTSLVTVNFNLKHGQIFFSSTPSEVEEKFEDDLIFAFRTN